MNPTVMLNQFVLISGRGIGSAQISVRGIGSFFPGFAS